MKKLNRKGFTLVELLAVIIILAIVVGITIPAVLTTTTNAKKKAFETAATTVADWIDRQYQVAITGLGSSSSGALATLDPTFKAQCGETGSSCTGNGKTITIAASGATAQFITAAGLKPANVATVLVKINASTGRSCVTLTAKAGGDYYDTISGNKVSGGACA